MEKHQFNNPPTHTVNKRMYPDINNKYAGLNNQGSTCYLNAVLQTLFMTKDFRNAVLQSSQQENVFTHKPDQRQKHVLTPKLAKLFKSLECGKHGNTEEITQALKIANVYEQQDAVKWFLTILNEVGPEVSKTFQGIMEYNTSCKNPKTEHKPMKQIDNLLLMPISLNMPSPINVQDCFESFFKPVSITGKNQLYCQTCKDMMDMETTCRMTKPPPVLVLQLKRFELNYNTMFYRKNTSRVQIPSQLTVKVESVEERVYELYAVVNHSGSLSGGHYYAEIKSFEDQQWYEFNDSRVNQIHCLEDVSDLSYLLFYKCDSTKVSEKDNCEAKPVEKESMEEDKSNDSECPKAQIPDRSIPSASDQESKLLSAAPGVHVPSCKPKKDSSEAKPSEEKEEESTDAESSNKSENLQTKNKNPEEPKHDHTSVHSKSDHEPRSLPGKDNREVRNNEDKTEVESMEVDSFNESENLQTNTKHAEEEKHDHTSVHSRSDLEPKPLPLKDSNESKPAKEKEKEVPMEVDSFNESENLQTNTKHAEEPKTDLNSVYSTSDQEPKTSEDETQKPPSEDESKANTQQAPAVVESGLALLHPRRDGNITNQNNGVNKITLTTPALDQTDDSAHNTDSEAKM